MAEQEWKDIATAQAPDDILKAAQEAQDAAEAECKAKKYVYGFGTGNAKTVLDLHIARAISAERERCALLADTYTDPIDIAHFIRSGRGR